MSKQLLASVIGASALLAGCTAFQPENYGCNDKLTAPADGARVVLRTLDNDKTADVRFNGVKAICEDIDGGVRMAIDAGLVVSRDKEDAFEITFAEVPLLLALLDQNDAPVGHESLSYRVAFDEGRTKLYPVAELEVVIPAGGRAVISLAPSVVR